MRRSDRLFQIVLMIGRERMITGKSIATALGVTTRTIYRDITDLKSTGVDEAGDKVTFFGVFSGTHTAEGGPVPPTGKKAEADYVYVADMKDGKIAHVTKVWNDGWTLQQLGWT